MQKALHSALGQSRLHDDAMISRQRKRQVCFSTEADDVFYLKDVAPASTMTNAERDSAWYTTEDMIHMKQEANMLARRMRTVAGMTFSSKRSLSGHSDCDGTKGDKHNLRRLDEEYPTNFPPQSSAAAAIEENSNETFRGLELRIFIGRQLKKYIAARTIMEYQRRNKLKIAMAAKNGDPNLQLLIEVASKKLGYVSAKCSRWARDMALATGESDSKAVREHVNDSFPTSCLEEGDQISLMRKRMNGFSDAVPRKKVMINVQ